MERKNTQMCPIVELYAYCFMNKQYMKGVENGKKNYFTSMVILAILPTIVK